MDSDDDFFVLDKKNQDEKFKGMIKEAKIIKKIVRKKKKILKKDVNKKILENLNQRIEVKHSKNSEYLPLEKHNFIPTSDTVSLILTEIDSVNKEEEMLKEKKLHNKLKQKDLTKKSNDRSSKDENDDYEILRIKNKFDKLKSSINQSIDLSKDKNNNNHNEINEIESKRIYQFKIISQLPGTKNAEIIVNITGDKKFKKLIIACLKNLASEYYIPEEFRHEYKIDNVLLLYKSKIKLQLYMRPSFLKLTNNNEDQVFVTVYLMTKDDVKKREDEEQNTDKFVFDNNDDEITIISDTEAELIEAEKEAKENKIVNEVENDGEMFKIILNDKDNSKIEVQVKPSTLLKNIKDYYLKKKNLNSSTKITLIFDDEELDLTQTVGDTEIEDEFGIDVIVD